MRYLSWPRPRALHSAARSGRATASSPFPGCPSPSAPPGTLVPTASLCRASEQVGSCSTPCQSPTLLLQAFSFPRLFPCSRAAASTNARRDRQLLGRVKLSLSWQQHGCLLGKYMCTSKTSPLLFQDGLLSASVAVGWYPYTAVQQAVAFHSALEAFHLSLTTFFPPWL